MFRWKRSYEHAIANSHSFLFFFFFFFWNQPTTASFAPTWNLLWAGVGRGTEHRCDFGGLLIPNPLLGFRTSAQTSQRLGDSNLRRSRSVDPESHALTI